MTKVGIIGGSGFAGEELIKLLSLHDSTSIIAISSRELKNTPVSDLFQGTDLNFVDPEDQIFFQCDVVFFATPHGLSLIHISEPTRPRLISYAVFCLKKKK